MNNAKNLKYFVISVVLAAPWEQNTAAYICDTSDSLSQYASDEVSGMSYTPVSTNFKGVNGVNHLRNARISN